MMWVNIGRLPVDTRLPRTCEVSAIASTSPGSIEQPPDRDVPDSGRFPALRVPLYICVSTLEQQPANQLAELRRYAEARGWSTPVEYVDHGISGVKERRPAVDRLLADAKRRRVDVVCVRRLDRLGRNLQHLITI